MLEISALLVTIVELGLLYALPVLSVHLSSNILGFDDLGLEGCFAVGGAVTASLLIHGIHPAIAVIASIVAGSTVGLAMGLLHTKMGMNNLIAGIIVTAALFSINLKIAGTNVVLNAQTTIFETLRTSALGNVPLLALIVGLVVCLLWFLLATEIGALLIAVGANPHMLTQLGKSVHGYKITGLMIAHAITGCAGGLFTQHIGLFSVTGTIGTLVTALAGLILGQVLCGKKLVGLIVGALSYQAIIALTIELRVDPALNKLITAVLVTLLIGIRHHKKQT